MCTTLMRLAAGDPKKDSKRRSESVSTATIARRDRRGAVQPIAKYLPIEVVGGNSKISQNGEEGFHYRQQATYASHLGKTDLERLWLL